MEMRPARYYKPYSVTLQKFTHERYAGTEIPKNFASRITLIDPERSVNRDVLNIYESSAALSRRNILPGWISEGRLGIHPAGRAQPKFHRALRRVRDCCRGIARAIRLSSRRFLARRGECARMKRFFPSLVFGLGGALGGVELACRQNRNRRFRSWQFRKNSGAGRRPCETARHGRAQFAPHHSRQTNAAPDDGKQLSAMQWLADTLFNAPVADRISGLRHSKRRGARIVWLGTERSEIFQFRRARRRS